MMTVDQAEDRQLSHGGAVMERFIATRKITEDLCRTLEPEDYTIQSSPDVSPPKWHLAHTTWFFETFILNRFSEEYKEYDPMFGYLYNSYYETVGTFFPRPNRGLISRPSHEAIIDYRHHVTEKISECFGNADEKARERIAFLVEIGINHEQQHQELLLMDLKQNFFFNPSFYPYSKRVNYSRSRPSEIIWLGVEEGIRNIGFSGNSFAFDNETPEHREYVAKFEIADRPVTNGEYLEFMNAGAYSTPELWLSDGWATVRKNGWNAPGYWLNRDGKWFEFRLSGLSEVDPDEPVCHVSHYEADAYARWSGNRLPTESEWETASKSYDQEVPGNYSDSGIYHPTAKYSGKIKKMFGDAWEWTSSAYLPYPGFKPLEGSLGEYNGKFMSGQMVLRGGSCLTPAGHVRPTYRNFFAPEKRWPVTGIRLARDVS